MPLSFPVVSQCPQKGSFSPHHSHCKTLRCNCFQPVLLVPQIFQVPYTSPIQNSPSFLTLTFTLFPLNLFSGRFSAKGYFRKPQKMCCIPQPIRSLSLGLILSQIRGQGWGNVEQDPATAPGQSVFLGVSIPDVFPIQSWARPRLSVSQPSYILYQKKRSHAGKNTAVMVRIFPVVIFLPFFLPILW